MRECDYVRRLKDLWPRGGSACSEALVLSEQAVRDYPSSAVLLCMRGDIIQMAPSEYVSSEDPKTCYLRAIDVAPQCCEAWESLAFYYDVFEADYVRAIEAFRRAIEYGAGTDSVRGLATALAENGQSGEALAVIRKALGLELSNVDRSSFCDLGLEIERGEYDSNKST